MLDAGFTDETKCARVGMITAQFRFKLRDLGGEGFGIFVQINEYESAKNFYSYFTQRYLIATQMVVFAGPGCPAKLACQTIGPGMVRTGQYFLALAEAFDQGMATMAADIVIGLQLSCTVSNYENAFINNGQGGEIAAVGYFGLVTDTLPAAKENIVSIEEEIFLVNLIFRRQR